MKIGQFEKSRYFFPTQQRPHNSQSPIMEVGCSPNNKPLSYTQSECSLENQIKALYGGRQGGGLRVVTTHHTTTHFSTTSAYTPCRLLHLDSFLKTTKIHLLSASVFLLRSPKGLFSFLKSYNTSLSGAWRKTLYCVKVNVKSMYQSGDGSPQALMT